MNWNQKQLLAEFCLLREKIDDVVTAHCWHGDDMFTARELETKDEMMSYALGYVESRIQHEHTTELMMAYLKQFDDLIENLKELGIEKNALSRSDQTEDNA